MLCWIFLGNSYVCSYKKLGGYMMLSPWSSYSVCPMSMTLHVLGNLSVAILLSLIVMIVWNTNLVIFNTSPNTVWTYLLSSGLLYLHIVLVYITMYPTSQCTHVYNVPMSTITTQYWVDYHKTLHKLWKQIQIYFSILFWIIISTPNWRMLYFDWL